MTNVALKFLNRYKVVIFFPTFTAGSIYADYSHTFKWKREKLEAQRSKEELSFK